MAIRVCGESWSGLSEERRAIPWNKRFSATVKWKCQVFSPAFQIANCISAAARSCVIAPRYTSCQRHSFALCFSACRIVIRKTSHYNFAVRQREYEPCVCVFGTDVERGMRISWNDIIHVEYTLVCLILAYHASSVIPPNLPHTRTPLP